MVRTMCARKRSRQWWMPAVAKTMHVRMKKMVRTVHSRIETSIRMMSARMGDVQRCVVKDVL